MNDLKDRVDSNVWIIENRWNRNFMPNSRILAIIREYNFLDEDWKKSKEWKSIRRKIDLFIESYNHTMQSKWNLPDHVINKAIGTFCNIVEETIRKIIKK